MAVSAAVDPRRLAALRSLPVQTRLAPLPPLAKPTWHWHVDDAGAPRVSLPAVQATHCELPAAALYWFTAQAASRTRARRAGRWAVSRGGAGPVRRPSPAPVQVGADAVPVRT